MTIKSWSLNQSDHCASVENIVLRVEFIGLSGMFSGLGQTQRPVLLRLWGWWLWTKTSTEIFPSPNKTNQTENIGAQRMLTYSVSTLTLGLPKFTDKESSYVAPCFLMF